MLIHYLFEFEHDPFYNKDTRRLEIERMLDDDYDYDEARPRDIVTIEKFINERLAEEVMSLSMSIEKEYF